MTLITGSALSQVVVYASILLLTRLFSAELFGIYILFSSATIILKPLATLQFEFAIVLPKKDKDAINLFAFSTLILILYCLLLLLIVSLFKTEILDFFNITVLSNFIYLLPLNVFLFGLIANFDYWNNRNDNFKAISKGLFLKSSSMSATQIATGFSSYNSIGLIPGMLIGYVLQIFYLLQLTYNKLQPFCKDVSLNRMLFLAKKYKDIPIFNSIINLTNNLSNELPVLLITKYFGLASSGIYGLAVKFMRAPIGVVQQSVNQVFFNKATKLYNDQGSLYALVLKTAKHLLIISLLIFTPLFILSYYLEFLFGEGWTDVGLYARILIPWLFFAFFSNPLNSLILILNKQKTMVVLDIALLIFRFLALFCGYYFYNDIIIALALFSMVGMIFNILIFIYLLQTSKEKNSAYQ
ncbi:lipopolysaccharide biosynthesis protein [Polaribacter sp. P097]|uniref:lipopolysaccharide biosynthesis protein n=1 Tax=Polaribacter sp. P097 TaxID=3117398 RepID=UPI002FE37E8F